MTGPAPAEHPPAAPLAVGINLCWLVPGVVGGSEDLLVGWLGALADHAPPGALQVTVFGPAALAEAHPRLADADGFEFVAAPVQGRAKGLRVVTESTWLAAQQRRRGLTVMHHAGGVVPLLHPGRSVLTVHDIQPLDLPENFSAIKRRYLGLMLPRSVRAADLLVVTSEFVVDRLVDRLGADRSRCRVVAPVLRPAAADVPRPAPALARAPAPAPGAGHHVDVDALRARYQLGPRWVLYPAVPYAHKNHRILYEAMRLLPAELDVQLVASGGSGPEDDALARFVADHGLSHRIRRVGRVDQADYEALVAHAAALVFPSRYEGFGLGAFDALARGVGVLAADIAPLAEVLGPQATLIDPDDAAAWAARIAAVVTDGELRAALASASVARAGLFSPQRSADALMAAYRAAAERPVGATSRSGAS